MTALATPFMTGGVDERAFVSHAAWQVDQGSDALVIGTPTGEAPTLTDRERERLIAQAAAVASGRVPILAGIVTNCTARAIEQANTARRAGAGAMIVWMPPYNRPTQEGLYRHVDAIARAVDLPLIVGNDASRTAVPLTPETADRLAALEPVVGFVDAHSRPARSSSGSPAKRIDLFTSSDDASLSCRIEGGAGTLSIAANIAPRLCASLHDACRAGDWFRAAEIQLRLRPLVKALALEPDPAPVKYALFLVRHHFSPMLRLPMVDVSSRTARAIAAAMAGLRDDIEFQP